MRRGRAFVGASGYVDDHGDGGVETAELAKKHWFGAAAWMSEREVAPGAASEV